MDTLEQDELGRVTAKRRGDNSLVWEATYDALGRPLTLENGEEEAASIAYGPSGQPSTITLPGSRVVTLTYDAAGRKTSVTRPYGGTTSYLYDERGLMTHLIDPNGQGQEFQYDAEGRLVLHFTKASGALLYTYDDAGRVLTVEDGNEDVLVHTYDEAGRMVSVEGPDAERFFTYDPLGRMLTASTGAHTLTWTYDEAGLLTQSSSDTGLHVASSFGFTRDDAGRLTTATGPSGTADYSYDLLGRLSEVDHATLGAFGFSWDSTNRPTALSRPNGATTSASYDGVDRVLGLVTEVSSTEVHSLTYAYDSRGYPSSLVSPEGTHSFTHDDLGRLTAADHPSGSDLEDESYTYDNTFRRTSWTNATGEHETSDVDHTNQDTLSHDLLWTYDYDDAGRRISRTGRVSLEETTYTWDSFGQLVAIGQPNGDTWSFDYDALGRRVLVEHDPDVGSTDVWTFQYDDQGLVRAVYDESEALVASYVTGFGFGEVLAEVRGSTVRYALRDKLGTAVAWLDDAGEVDEEVLRDSYGVRVGAVTEPVAYGYTGHAEDPTGLATYLEYKATLFQRGYVLALHSGHDRWMFFGRPLYCVHLGFITYQVGVKRCKPGFQVSRPPFCRSSRF